MNKNNEIKKYPQTYIHFFVHPPPTKKKYSNSYDLSVTWCRKV